jgi:hypothetical protein
VLQVQGEPPDSGPPPHLHRDTAEAFYVLEGESLMHLQDRQQLARPAPSCTCPETRHTRSRWSPPYPAISWFSSCQLPRLGYFEELAAAEAAGSVTPELLDAIATRNNVEMCGPVSDTYL